MRKITLTLTALLLLLFNLNAQNSGNKSLEKEKAEQYLSTQGELTFTFQVESDSDVEQLTRDMSLIHYDPVTKTVKAWANEEQFRSFETSNIPYYVPKSENEADESFIYDVRPLAARSAASTLTFPLSSYPTYAEYAQQMQDFEDDYPALVEKISIGTTGQGDKELLFVKISDNVSVDEKEPKLMFTSSMHGDEIAGYPMMLTLIDYILTVYSNPGHSDHLRVKNLVENAELWINPSANPDGTYHNSATNTSVVNARRGNGNNIDLNRNYPDNIAGPHDDGNAYQTETIAFMNFADAHNFVISANFHGGTELVNYPFDNAYVSQHEHSDGDWFEYVGVEYATNAQIDANSGNMSSPTYTNKASYMTDDDDSNVFPSPGVTHGAEWYRVYGGRQDYMNFYQHCREVTIELSDQKILQESLLDDYWYYNRDALLDYLTQGTYGFRGDVLDATTSNPIEGVKVTVVGHDAYGSEVYTDTQGDYYRPIKAGTYDFLFEAPCYSPVTVTGQTITDGTTVVLSDVQMTPLSTVPTGLAASNISTAVATLNWDEISGMTYDLRYREVGATSWTTISVTGATFQLTGLTALTQYEVQIRSNCGSFNSVYSSSVVFTTIDVVACTGTLISSFPYLETFDSGLGDWSQDSGDDGNWSLDASGTPTGNTGPSDDISEGGNYLYTEASGNGLGSNATVLLTSPCYDLTNYPDAYFSFYYHMFGNNMGTLNLEATSDDGDNWTNIFSASGNLGNSWNLQNIDLSGYFGETVKFRFIGTTGGGIRSDMAIDHIGVGSKAYCISEAKTNSNQLGIQRVQLSDLDNLSGIDVYSDFTSMSATLSKNTTYSIAVTPMYNNVNTTNAVGYGVWIDFNNDGDFTDSGEQIFSQSPVTGGNTVTGNFNVPANITTGNTTMRVSMKFNGIPGACESFSYGEVEDYSIYLFNGLLYHANTWTPGAPTSSTTTEDVLILNGTYQVNSTDIATNNLFVRSGATLNVNKEFNLTVAGNIVNNGELVLNSDSNEFSSLMVDGSVSGNVKYNRHVTSNAGGNDIIAPPVSGEAFTSFIANNSNIFSNSAQTLYLFGPFEKPSNDYQLYSNVETATLEAGKGYRAASTDDGTFTFSGEVTTETLSVPIIQSGGDFARWNLIGNPYTSYIKLSDFLEANLNELDPNAVAIYGYDADSSYGTEWTIWNIAYSDNNPNSLIAPGQGFFVSSKDTGSNVVFNPSMRSSGTSDDFIAGRNLNLAHFVIKMTSTEKTYNTDIYFKDSGTLGLDIGYDAELFGEEPPAFSIYSQLTENNQDLNMAIQTIGFNDVNGTTVIPLGVNLLQGRQVVIGMDTSNLDYNVYLEDTYTNTTVLLNTSDYNLTAETDLNGTGRFYLRFENETLSMVESNLNNIQIYNNSELKEITIKGQLNEDTTFVMYDIHGREIIRTNLNTNHLINVINASNYAKGVYLVQLSNTSNVISKKLIIR